LKLPEGKWASAPSFKSHDVCLDDGVVAVL
jgi:hypothetical protein